jgi:hypothetical protein
VRSGRCRRGRRRKVGPLQPTEQRQQLGEVDADGVQVVAAHVAAGFVERQGPVRPVDRELPEGEQALEV